MKNILSTLFLVSLFISCASDDYQYTESINSGFMTQTPVPDKIIGHYTAEVGRVESNTGNPLETGIISITKDVIDINLTDHKYHLVVNDYRTAANLLQDCFFDIYLKDGTVIRIQYAWLQSDGVIWLMVDDVIYAILKPIGIESLGSVETPQTEQPQFN